ncbi:MAG: DNA repair protein RecO [Polyangiaceae bacterium]|nr:DNA repair protein RecO [Polyangiaceae bacterium]
MEHDTRALLLRRVPVGESDLVVTLLTEDLGRVSALARSARKSQRRFGGVLEPLHTLRARLEERGDAELMVLCEVRLEAPRSSLLGDLECLRVGGRALGWVRDASPPRAPEPAIWDATISFLDDLALPEPPGGPDGLLASLGLSLLLACGWALDLEVCVGCGKRCPEGRPAMVDPQRGGLVCRACGGARLRLPGPVRSRLASTARGALRSVSADDAPIALELVEQALAAHLGIR